MVFLSTMCFPHLSLLLPLITLLLFTELFYSQHIHCFLEHGLFILVLPYSLGL